MSTWVPPTVAEFRARFPGFSGYPDETVQVVLDEAIEEVGRGCWVEKDKTKATLYLTAHLLQTEEQGLVDPAVPPSGGGGGAGSSTVLGGQLKRRTVGDVTVEWSVDSSKTSSGAASGAGGATITGEYWATPYGQRYLELMKKNFPAVRVV